MTSARGCTVRNRSQKRMLSRDRTSFSSQFVDHDLSHSLHAIPHFSERTLLLVVSYTATTTDASSTPTATPAGTSTHISSSTAAIACVCRVLRVLCRSGRRRRSIDVVFWWLGERLNLHRRYRVTFAVVSHSLTSVSERVTMLT